jgi:hypothetical protein
VNRVNRTIISFKDESYLQIELHGDLFRLAEDESNLVATLMDLLHQYKKAQAKKLNRTKNHNEEAAP